MLKKKRRGNICLVATRMYRWELLDECKRNICFMDFTNLTMNETIGMTNESEEITNE